LNRSYALCTLLLFAAFARAFADGERYPGDLEFSRLDYPRAEAVYDSVLQLQPGNAEMLWRMSRLYVVWGDIVRKEEKEKK